MKEIVVTEQPAGTAGLKLVGRHEPSAAKPATLAGSSYDDVVVEVHAVTALSSTTTVSVGQPGFDVADGTRTGSLTEHVVVEVRSLAPLPSDVDFTVDAGVAMTRLTAGRGLFEHGHCERAERPRIRRSRRGQFDGDTARM